MTIPRYLTRLGIALAGAAVLTLAGCDLVYSLLGWKVDKGSVQVMQGATDLTAGGTYDFGSVGVGLQGSPVDFTIANSGTAAASLTYGDGAHASAADFSITGPTTTTVAPGSSTTFSVTFAPRSFSSISSTISVQTSEGAIDFTARGTGISSGSFSLEYSNDGGTTWNHVAQNDTVPYPQLNSTSPPYAVDFRVSNLVPPQLAIRNGPFLTTNNYPGDYYPSFPTSPVDYLAPTTFQITFYYSAGGIASDDETFEIDTSDNDGGNAVFTFSVSGSTS